MPRRKDSDEAYVIDLCDEVLSLKAVRQHRDPQLLGDISPKTGRSIRLPIDAYYSELGLAIEYQESQHTVANRHFDKPAKLTVSGVHRGEQRRLYDERKAKFYGGRLIIVDHKQLALKGGRVDRAARPQNTAVIKRLLAVYL